MSNLAQRIAEKRKGEGLSLREAGKASGVAFSTLARVESGAEPSYRVAQQIEAWLRGEAPTLPPPPMTLRDWFAGQALGGLASATDGAGIWMSDALATAEWAYRYADAMIAERGKPGPA